jgi:uncharacterized protein YqgV (UPF0045/DUF77 family)
MSAAFYSKLKCMQATLEMSMYPLQSDYKNQILEFIRDIKSQHKLTVRVNGLSTQVFGEYEDIINLLQSEVKRELEKEMGVVFVMKLTSGRHDEVPKV